MRSRTGEATQSQQTDIAMASGARPCQPSKAAPSQHTMLLPSWLVPLVDRPWAPALALTLPHAAAAATAGLGGHERPVHDGDAAGRLRRKLRRLSERVAALEAHLKNARP